MSARILVLDDDPRFRTLVRCTLAERGHEVLEVTRAERAKDVVTDKRFDLLVVDGLLPDGSGVNFIAWARNQGYAGPILFVSQFWRDLGTFKTLTEDWAVTRVLSKPLSAAQLLVEVETILERRERANPQAAGPADPERFERELRALREDYADGFEEALGEVGQALARARQTRSKDALEEAHRLAHSLAGSAGSFGFRETGELMRQIELRLEELVDLAAPPAKEAFAPLVGSLAAAGRRLAAEARRVLAASESPSISAAQEAAGERSHLARILVVDDDPHMLSQLDVVGRQHMIEVFGVRTGDEAVARARSEALDGAVIDIHLRDGESGYEVAHRLRSEAGHADLPLAFFSRDTSLGSRVRAAHAGASLFLDKAECEEAFPTAVRHFAALRADVRPRVVLLSDDLVDADHIANLVEQAGVEVQVTTDPASLLETLSSVHPSLLLVKASMKRVSGFDICKMVRTTPTWQDLPVLLLTHDEGKQVRRACFEAGADDFVSLPADLEELRGRLAVLLERVRLHRERADRDALTGLLMRRPFLEAFKARLSEAQRDEKSLSLCMIDLDHFKELNDTHGHAAGDRVLAAFGNLLASRFRVSDIRARWGGEEFAVVLFGEGASMSQRILQRVLDEFAAMEFEGDDGTAFRASFSAGIAAYPKDGGAFQRLFRSADARLYRAKEAGRRRIERKGGAEEGPAAAGAIALRA